jgi:hypothetical protein
MHAYGGELLPGFVHGSRSRFDALLLPFAKKLHYVSCGEFFIWNRCNGTQKEETKARPGGPDDELSGSGLLHWMGP